MSFLKLVGYILLKLCLENKNISQALNARVGFIVKWGIEAFHSPAGSALKSFKQDVVVEIKKTLNDLGSCLEFQK